MLTAKVTRSVGGCTAATISAPLQKEKKTCIREQLELKIRNPRLK